ncbi:hypothetical protein [Rheinheimera sp. 1928-s]|uniref:hypothetical protein n=1 Tax=Rheinheimera sp. 1928-s TaxID=3033803 RepID=UPI002637EFAA|nr:hypothetical protein [Rheinheimera sp. 1928-s]MDF3125760.1 hypothetical protein [Rheinheimera sp. 1928-s]
MNKLFFSLGDIYFPKLFFFIFLYVYIFQPPVVNKLFYAAFGFMIFLLFFVSKMNYSFLYFRRLKYEITLGLLLVFFSGLRDFFSGEIVYSDRFVIWFLQSLIFPVYVIYIFEKHIKKKICSSTDLLNFIYYVVAFAGFVTCLLILIPAFDRFYETIQVDDYYERYKSFEFRYRAYGISENLTFTYGYLLGLFAALALLKLKESYLHIFIFSMLLVGVAFNARIGFFPVIFMLIYLATIGFRLKNLVLFSIFIFVLFSFLFRSVESPEELFYWPLMFFYELIGFFTSGDGGTASTLLNDFIIIPSDVWQVLFGKGISLFGLESGSSDVGYILLLNYAGVFFAFLVVVFFTVCSVRLYFTLGLRNWYFWFFTFSIFFLNTKGFLLAATPGARLLFLLYCYFIFTTLRVKNNVQVN